MMRMAFKLALIQNDMAWEQAGFNLHHLSHLLQGLEDDVDLLVLPEMFATGFSMDTTRIAQGMDGQVVEWMQKMAGENATAIMGSQAIKEQDKIYNRVLFVTPDQQVQYYDKRHLFSPGEEHLNYTPGVKRAVFNYKGVRIFPQVCYDLRFPVWGRNINDYDLAVYVANWPAVRGDVWDVLIKARAIENQCYVCAVNRVGEGGGIHYSGASQVIDFKGQVQLHMNQSVDSIAYCELDMLSLASFRKKFPSLADADDFTLLVD